MGDFLRWPCKLSIVLCQLFLDKCSVLHNGDIPRNRMYAYKADAAKPLTCSQFISVELYHIIRHHLNSIEMQNSDFDLDILI